MFKRLSYLGLASCAAAVGWAQSSSLSTVQANNTTTGTNSPFSQKNWTAFELKKIEDVNHNTKIFHFGLNNNEETINLPVASCITTHFIDSNGKDVIRPYTPINQNAKGEFQLLIKKYPQGIMSQYIHGLKIGDKLETKGPFDKLQYTKNMKKFIGLIAGGTGITPMLQIIEKILNDDSDHTVVNLLFANISEKDILLKDTLDILQEKHPHRFRVYYIIDKPSLHWPGFSGYINEEILRKTMPPASQDSLICVCGPPPMMKNLCGERKSVKDQGPVTGQLKNLGYDDNMVFKF